MTHPTGETIRRVLTSRLRELSINSRPVELTIEPAIGDEGFRIEDGDDGVRIIGNDERGLIYGVGKFLRNPDWRGTSVPKLPVRGIYFATHFHNFYHDAPVEHVQRYIEDLALWGINSLTVWFDMHHFNGIEDPKAQALLARLRSFFETAGEVGMDTGLVLIANEGYANSPVEMRATGPGRGGFYGMEICPNASGARELILRQFEQEFAQFADVGVNHVWIWPYDQGSCSCEECRPWGSNGYLETARPISDLVRASFPGCKVYLSAWYMDDNEWAGIASALSADPHWADGVILQPDHFGAKTNAASPMPVLGFPEISMAGMYPWGGFGANPQPDAFQKYWDGFRFGTSAPLKSRNIGPAIAGGWPYSEGVFEDINKVMFAQLYWDPERDVWDIVREYATSEFGPESAEDVLAIVRILEQNHHPRWWPDMSKRNDPFQPENIAPQPDHGAEEAYGIAKRVDSGLGERARNSWRWRILYLRALLDAELKTNGGKPNDTCEQAFQELTRLYFAQNAEGPVRPPASTSHSLDLA